MIDQSDNKAFIKTVNNSQPAYKRKQFKKEILKDPAIEIDLDTPLDVEGDLAELKEPDTIISFNYKSERVFVAIVRKLLAKYGPMRRRIVCIETAARLNVSLQTAKNYLDKHSSSISEFKIEQGWVTERKKK